VPICMADRGLLAAHRRRAGVDMPLPAPGTGGPNAEAHARTMINSHSAAYNACKHLLPRRAHQPHHHRPRAAGLPQGGRLHALARHRQLPRPHLLRGTGQLPHPLQHRYPLNEVCSSPTDLRKAHSQGTPVQRVRRLSTRGVPAQIGWSRVAPRVGIAGCGGRWRDGSPFTGRARRADGPGR
jgi:hypothetical protein